MCSLANGNRRLHVIRSVRPPFDKRMHPTARRRAQTRRHETDCLNDKTLKTPSVVLPTFSWKRTQDASARNKNEMELGTIYRPPGTFRENLPSSTKVSEKTRVETKTRESRKRRDRGRLKKQEPTKHGPSLLDDVLSFPDHGNDGSRSHVFDETWEERLGGEVGVVLLEVGLRGVDQFAVGERHGD